MKCFLVVFAAIIACTSAVEFSDCGSEIYVQSSEIIGCEDTPSVCVLKADYNYTLTITLNNVPSFNKLENKAYFKYFGFTFGITTTPDPCKQFICPFNEMPSLTYNATFTVPHDLAFPLGGTFHFSAKSNSVLDAICLEAPVKVISEPESDY